MSNNQCFLQRKEKIIFSFFQYKICPRTLLLLWHKWPRKGNFWIEIFNGSWVFFGCLASLLVTLINLLTDYKSQSHESTHLRHGCCVILVFSVMHMSTIILYICICYNNRDNNILSLLLQSMRRAPCKDYDGTVVCMY